MVAERKGSAEIKETEEVLDFHGAGSSGRRTRVLLTLPLAGPLDYLADQPLAAGSFVRVPLSGRTVTGVVWDDETGLEVREVPRARLKHIEAVLDAPPLSKHHRQFIEWVADYTLSPPGAVLRMSMSAPAALREPPMKSLYFPGGEAPKRMTAPRQAVLDLLADGRARAVKDIVAEAGVSEAVVRGLVKLGSLIAVRERIDKPFVEPNPEAKGPILSDEQAVAARALKEAVRRGEFQATLLEGVTGSGKTEVYFEAIAEALRIPGSQVLVLLPEIALTSQWLDRFEARFEARPVEWHSDLTLAQRRRAWRGVAEGEARLVVGARSALFLPFQTLSLIVVDEEHDASFKQEDGVFYNARDMAIVRASLEEVLIVLASATPSFETILNVKVGKYTRLELPERHGGAAMPEIIAVDMRVEGPPPGRWVSERLEDALRDTLDNGEQGLLFLNRRGYAPLTICRACGERMECPNCTAWLVEHRYRHELHCHHCGYQIPIPESCPACGAEGKLVPSGPGVERLEEEIRTLFPEARLLIMTSDTVASPEAARIFVGKVERQEVDIIIGTQIVTKGHHFPQLTCVGVIDADLGLRGGDLRASERTFQQLEQVGGRAGREAKPGRVFLQTYMPEHPVAEALLSADRTKFVRRELRARERYGMPPFGRLAAVIVSGPDQARALTVCRQLSGSIPREKGVEVLGPVPAPLARLKGQFRFRFLVKTGKGFRIQAFMRRWLARAGQFKGARVKVDIDPQSFL